MYVNNTGQKEIYKRHEQVINEVIEKEDSLLLFHSNAVEESKEMNEFERKILGEIQEVNSDVNVYLEQLENLLGYKEYMIREFRAKIEGLRSSLKEEENYSNDIGKNKNAIDVFDLDDEEFLENAPLF